MPIRFGSMETNPISFLVQSHSRYWVLPHLPAVAILLLTSTSGQAIFGSPAPSVLRSPASCTPSMTPQHPRHTKRTAPSSLSNMAPALWKALYPTMFSKSATSPFRDRILLKPPKSPVWHLLSGSECRELTALLYLTNGSLQVRWYSGPWL